MAHQDSSSCNFFFFFAYFGIGCLCQAGCRYLATSLPAAAGREGGQQPPACLPRRVLGSGFAARVCFGPDASSLATAMMS